MGGKGNESYGRPFHPPLRSLNADMNAFRSSGVVLAHLSSFSLLPSAEASPANAALAARLRPPYLDRTAAYSGVITRRL